MNRQQRRQQERNRDKVRNRLYTFEECLTLIKDTEMKVGKKYDALYTLGIVCALTAEPYKFGKKRVREFMDSFFGQIEGLTIGTVDIDMMVETAKQYGITISHEDGKFSVNIDGLKKEKQYADL